MNAYDPEDLQTTTPLKTLGDLGLNFVKAILIIAAAIAVVFGILTLIIWYRDRPDWKRIYSDIGVKKGESYPTEYIDTELAADPDWGITEEDIRTAWKYGVGEFDEGSGYMYILEVSFDRQDTERYYEHEHSDDGKVICYKCKIYQGKGKDGVQNWAPDYTVSDIPFALSVKKNPDTGEWELNSYGYA